MGTDTELVMANPASALAQRNGAATNPGEFMAWYNAPEGTPVPSHLTPDEAIAWAGNFRYRMSKLQWKLVELILVCRDRWGEMYVQIAECTGLSPERLKVMLSTGEATKVMRHNLLAQDAAFGEVPFSYFEAVAGSHIPDKKKQELIEAAFHAGLNRDDFRAYVQRECPRPEGAIGGRPRKEQAEDADKSADVVFRTPEKKVAAIRTATALGFTGLSGMMDAIAEGTLKVEPAAVARDTEPECFFCDGPHVEPDLHEPHYTPEETQEIKDAAHGIVDEYPDLDEQEEAPTPSEGAVNAPTMSPVCPDFGPDLWSIRLSPAARECLPDLCAYYRTEDMVDVVSRAVMDAHKELKRRRDRRK